MNGLTPHLDPKCHDASHIAWYDKKVINLITIFHSAITFRKQIRSKHHDDNVGEIDKPCAVQAYSKLTGGIDHADKAMTFYMVLHKCCKGWKKTPIFLPP